MRTFLKEFVEEIYHETNVLAVLVFDAKFSAKKSELLRNIWKKKYSKCYAIL